MKFIMYLCPLPFPKGSKCELRIVLGVFLRPPRSLFMTYPAESSSNLAIKVYYKGYVGYKDLVLLNSQLIRLQLSCRGMSWVDTCTYSEAVQPLAYLTVFS